MKHVHLDAVPWLEWHSTTGRFQGYGRQVSQALGAVRNANLAAGGHPFDLEFGRLPPGKAGCPFHRHTGQWEFYFIADGSGAMRHGSERRALRAGDLALHPPGSAHQLINTGDTDLTYWLVADNPSTEICAYPDSDKFMMDPGGAVFRKTDVQYDVGEDDGPGTDEPPAPRPLPDTPARFLHVDEIPWARRHSPKGRYDTQCRDLSLALGGKRNADATRGGHPFDLQIRRVAAGAAICPYHSHSAQWEMMAFLAGRGHVRTAEGIRDVGPGDIVLHPPGHPHQTRAAADSTLDCLIITDNPFEDVFHYPDSNKWGTRRGGKIFRMVEADYFDGEE